MCWIAPLLTIKCISVSVFIASETLCITNSGGYHFEFNLQPEAIPCIICDLIKNWFLCIDCINRMKCTKWNGEILNHANELRLKLNVMHVHCTFMQMMQNREWLCMSGKEAKNVEMHLLFQRLCKMLQCHNCDPGFASTGWQIDDGILFDAWFQNFVLIFAALKFFNAVFLIGRLMTAESIFY